MDYEEILRRIETLEAKRQRAEGKLETHLAELKEQFGLESLEDLDRELKKTQRQVEKAEKDLEGKTQEFLQRWGDRLREL